MVIRDFQLRDVDRIVECLTLNHQYGNPAVDGPAAMTRVKACPAAVFLVAEVDGNVVGAVRGTYVGSRAIIHQLSVHPAYQRQGIGRALVTAIVTRFRAMGAPTTSTTVTEASLPFWQKVGFRRTRAFLVSDW